MKLTAFYTETRLRLALALLGGVLLGLAYPTPGIAGFAWFVPGLWLFAALGLRGALAFRLGYAAGLVHFLLSLRWLLHIPFPSGAVAGWLALAGYLALFPAVWVWLATRIIERAALASFATPALEIRDSKFETWRSSLLAFASLSWFRRSMMALTVAALWVAIEMVQARLFSGFPWNFLGVSQWRNAPVIQVASVAGVYGVSFLVCWCSVALGGALILVALRPANRFSWLAEGRLPLVALLILVGIGFNRIMPARDAVPAPASLRVALVQPSIAQQLIWDDAASPARFQKAFDLTRQAAATQPDVLVWPEGFLPGFNAEQYAAMTNLTASAKAWWIFGDDDRDTGPNGKPRYYNSAVLVSPEGRTAAVYHKQHLVIFGEYVPLADVLPFLKWLTPIGDGFTAGDRPGLFPVVAGGRTNRFTPVICFEDIFPQHTRTTVAPDTDWLLEMTNDGWFGESGAQWQHCANAAFRAVENGVPLVRCANNGLTCWIDEFGRLRDVLGQGQGSVYDAGFLLVNLPVPEGGRRSTFYRDHGDVFGWLCVGLSGLALVQLRLQKRPS
ncbi:MAG TPA: apolipoprotein N-acyltransferase [Candidatus Limnocylindria bacterium]|nr:apolipoprotein N-acyltransferase [Candidatus Limnocylindria bacterium]